MKLEDLKFPTGEFTHTMLAEHNGVKNQAVWSAYVEARNTGVIVAAGKNGKATLWKLADPNAASAPVVVVNVNPNNVVAVSPSSVPSVPAQTLTVVVDGDEIEKEIVEKVKKKLETADELTIEDLRPVVGLHGIVTDTTFKCPICGSPLKACTTDTGVMVACVVKDFTVCKSTENPYGHGRNEKEAYAILCDKWKHH